MTREEFKHRETCIFITSEIHDINEKIGYYDYVCTEDKFRADLMTYEGLISRDEEMINTMIESLTEDLEEAEDEDLQRDIREVIECLEELKRTDE